MLVQICTLWSSRKESFSSSIKERVADHRELERLARRDVLLLGALDDVLDHLEVDERLAALELDGDAGARRLEHEVDGPVGRLLRHVRVDRVHVGARGVAVDAGLVAAQRHHEDVQVRPVVEEALAAGDHLARLGLVVGGAQEVAIAQGAVELAPLLHRARGVGREVRVAQDEPPALEVCHERPVGRDLAEAEEGLAPRVELLAQVDELHLTSLRAAGR
ncbi:MAG: hypothetical protein M5U28_15515 [Sandaracinaceae bacterium]|nr:hypothetical protein [Sandaracinaceae bacterium]